jgi:hypothetical protein
MTGSTQVRTGLPAWRRGWWPALAGTAARVAAAHRAQVALWEKVYSWPPDDGALHWVATVDGPVLRGQVLPGRQLKR